MPADHQTLRTIPVRQSLLRPNLLMGGERTFVLLNGSLAAALILGVGTWSAAVIGALLCSFAHWCLVLLAKRDPQMSQVFRDVLHQQLFYPAGAWVHARVRTGRQYQPR